MKLVVKWSQSFFVVGGFGEVIRAEEREPNENSENDVHQVAAEVMRLGVN